MSIPTKRYPLLGLLLGLCLGLGTAPYAQVTLGGGTGAGGAASAWGSITGTLSAQTDLQTALTARLPLAGGTMTGALLFSTDNTLDIGASGATRPRLGYFRTGVFVQAASVNDVTELSSSGLTVRTNATGQVLGTYANSGVAQIALGALGYVSWQSTNRVDAGSVDLSLFRGGANTLDLRNLTNAQRLNIGNTFTDATHREDLSLYFSSNIAHVGTTTTGGTARAIQLDYGGTTTAAISIPITSGDLTFGGVLAPTGYKSSDGTAGATTTCTIVGLTSITVKNGLITGCS